MRSKKRAVLLVATGLSSLLTGFVSGPSMALAQVAAEAPSVSDGEILVTATRREQSLLSVPLSITAISGDQLAEYGQDDLADFIRQVPGVNFIPYSSGLNAITIRGVTGGFQRAKAPVSFYIDDMPIVSDPIATPDVKTFDIERVEVLRGPQGTLFGESAIGGVIRVISKKPNLREVEGKLQVGYLDFSHGSSGYSIDAVANIPLVTDKVAIRGSISHRSEGGYIDNVGLGIKDQNKLDYLSGRLTAFIKPNERFDISATAYIVRSEYGAYPEADRNFEQARYKDETRNDDITQFNLSLNYEFDFATLTSSTSYMKRTTSRLFDLRDAFNGFLPPVLNSIGAAPEGFQFNQYWQTLDVDDKSVAQEIRLVSPAGRAFRWVAGLYYFDTDNFVGVDFLGDPDLDFNYLRLRRNENYKQRAVFAEVEYDLTSKLTFIAGARYTDEDRSTKYDQQDDWPFAMFLPAIGQFRVDVDYNILTPKFALQYKPSETSQVYVSATRGFRGPGGNTDFDNVGETGLFGAETLWSYELGSKASLFDRRLTLEGAIFYSDWADRQEIANPEALPPQQYVSNIGDAELWGVEVAGSYVISSHITVGGQISYLKTKVKESTNADLVGKELTFQPNWRGSAYVDLSVPLGGDFVGKAHFDVVHQGNSWWTATNRTGDYTLVNGNIVIDQGRWSAGIFMRNITDKFVALAPGAAAFQVGEPRAFGATFGIKF